MAHPFGPLPFRGALVIRGFGGFGGPATGIGSVFTRYQLFDSLLHSVLKSIRSVDIGYHVDLSATSMRTALNIHPETIGQRKPFQVCFAPELKVAQKNLETGGCRFVFQSSTLVHDIRVGEQEERIVVEATRGDHNVVNLVVLFPKGSTFHFCGGGPATIISKKLLDELVEAEMKRRQPASEEHESSNHPPSTASSTTTSGGETRDVLGGNPNDFFVFEPPEALDAGKRRDTDTAREAHSSNAGHGVNSDSKGEGVSEAAADDGLGQNPQAGNPLPNQQAFFGSTTGDAHGLGADDFGASTGITSTAEIGNAPFAEGLFRAGTPAVDASQVDLAEVQVGLPIELLKGDMGTTQEVIQADDNTCNGPGDALLFASGQPNVITPASAVDGDGDETRSGGFDDVLRFSQEINPDLKVTTEINADGRIIESFELPLMTGEQAAQFASDHGVNTDELFPTGNPRPEIIVPADDDDSEVTSGITLATAEDMQQTAAERTEEQNRLFPPGSLEPETNSVISDEALRDAFGAEAFERPCHERKPQTPPQPLAEEGNGITPGEKT